MEPAVLASSGGGAWAGAACDQFQAPNGTWFPAAAQAPSTACAYGAPDCGAAADDMHAQYAEQLNEMLRYANQCSAALGSKYRYTATRHRPSSAAAARHRMPVALEGCVERHVVEVRSTPPALHVGSAPHPAPLGFPRGPGVALASTMRIVGNLSPAAGRRREHVARP
jgi:hypothetical protein